MIEVTMYTDGGCRGNPGVGGWGAVITSGPHEKKIYGSEAETTNNRMEMTAALEGLRTLKKPCKVTVYTDSVYLRDGITKWLAGWKRNNWKTAAKKPVKNQDIWQALDAEQSRHQVEWKWVKGHAGIEGNEIADQLANKAMDEFQK